MDSPPIPFDDLRRALVVKLRHHGDVLLAAPVLSALRHAAPHCAVDALTYADTAPMLAGHPALTQLHVIDRGWKRLGVVARAAAEMRLLADLRARRYDLVVHLSVQRRGAWLVRLLRPRWSVAPAYSGGFWERSFARYYPAQSHPDRHTVETNLDSLRALGYQPAQQDKRVTLVPGAAAEARVDALLAERKLARGQFVHLHPASRWSFKCWPMDKVAALCDLFAAQGWPLALTAAPDDKERAMIAQVAAAAHSPFIDLSGQLSLKELAALTARARLFVGVDSAPMHIAAAMGTPTVAIFGPSGDREWGPWQVASRIVVSAAHLCRPCGSDGCEHSKISRCLTELPVEQVWNACTALLAETAA